MLCLGKSALRYEGWALNLSLTVCWGSPWPQGHSQTNYLLFWPTGVKTTGKTSTHPCAQQPWPQFMSNEIFMIYGKN